MQTRPPPESVFISCLSHTAVLISQLKLADLIVAPSMLVHIFDCNIHINSFKVLVICSAMTMIRM